MTEKRYLGDGVSAEIEHQSVKLTVENGLAVTNTIYLEPEVMEALKDFWKDATAPQGEEAA